MNSHLELNDLEFERQFGNGTLNPELFNHEAHIRLSWIHISNYGIEKATENICSQLMNFVTLLGVAEKFDKALTVTAIEVVYHFMLRSKSASFESFINEFPELKYNFKELVFSHYED
ncbi:MAG: hypothetical protein WCY89_06145 [Flavobacteriaceae bacterium]